MVKKHFNLDLLMSLAILVLLLIVFRIDPFPVKYFREKSFDIYQRIKPRSPPMAENRFVTIIDIDEQSLEDIGQWPWSRKTIARLVSNLHEMGAAAIVFDIVFSEADRLNPVSLAQSLQGINKDLHTKILALNLESNDQIFGRSISRANVVLGRAAFWDQLPNKAEISTKRAIAIRKLNPDSKEATDSLIDMPTLIRNLPLLEENANGIGVFAFKPVLDGIVRQVPLVYQHHGDIYPSLSIEAIRVALQVPTLMLNMDPNGVNSISIAPRSMVKPNGLKINTDTNGQIRPYFTPADPSIYVSAVDILSRQVDKSRITGKIAFIGSSAVGLLDIRSTPISPQVPGVEIHAQVVENILAIDRNKGALVAAQQFLRRSEFASKGGEIILIAIGGFLMIIITPLLGATRSLIAFLLLAGCTIAASWYLFSTKHILLDATFPILTAFILYSTLTYLHYSREEIAKKQIRSAFSKYLSPAMVEVVARHPEKLKLGGQNREMTLLFCDVHGFTTISEQFDAKGLTRLINKLLSPLSDIILASKGTIDKYMGDCIMAFWNAPLDDINHASNGCICALKMISEMGPLNKRLEKEAQNQGRKHIPLKVGIGLNSGECVVGNMGSDQRFDYSVLGDNVNLASRLEGQSKNYGVDIIIGENTQAQVPGLATIELDKIKVKGKSKAVHIFALVGDEEMAKTGEFQTFKKSVADMLALWRKQDWSGTAIAIENARKLGRAYNMDGFFALFDKRAADYQVNPPDADWDGVFVATTK